MEFNPLSLDGRAVLVTGASSGIGRDTSLVLSQLGARVVLCGRNAERLEETRNSLTGQGHLAESCDLANIDLAAWLKDVSSRAGTLAGLVHSAGIYKLRPVRTLRDVDINEIMTVNFSVAASLVRGFRQRGVYEPKGSSVVLVSSVAGLVGQPGLSAYSASKGALNAFARSAALELARDGMRVNCVAPGQIASPMAGQGESFSPEQFAAIQAAHPLGLGSARDVAHAIAFLLADTGRWITGTTLIVDGGYTAQ